MMSYQAEFSQIVAQDGMYGLTRGLSGQLLRDVPGFGVYFALYHFLKRRFYNEDSNLESFLRLFACGAATGMVTFLLAFPADQIKSRMMAHKGCRLSVQQVAQ